MHKRLFQCLAFTALLALFALAILQESGLIFHESTHSAHQTSTDQEFFNSSTAANPVETSLADGSWKKQLSNHPVRWGIEERSRILALEPSRLLELLDDDALLVRQDARDLIREIYGACGVVLASVQALPHGENAPLSKLSSQFDGSRDNSWCTSLLGAIDENVPWMQVKRLLDLAEYADPLQAGQGERAESFAADAASLGGGSLEALLLEDDAIQVAAALAAMQDIGDTAVVADWAPLNQLDANQQNMIWQALWHGLDCQWTGNCSQRSLPVTALCNWPSFQCDVGADYYAIMHRNLSPAQFEVLTMLMNQVNAYRRQRGG